MHQHKQSARDEQLQQEKRRIAKRLAKLYNRLDQHVDTQFRR